MKFFVHPWFMSIIIFASFVALFQSTKAPVGFATFRYGEAPLRYVPSPALAEVFRALDGTVGTTLLVLFLLLTFLPVAMPAEADAVAGEPNDQLRDHPIHSNQFLGAAVFLYATRLLGRVYILGETETTSQYLNHALDITLSITVGGIIIGLPLFALGHMLGSYPVARRLLTSVFATHFRALESLHPYCCNFAQLLSPLASISFLLFSCSTISAVFACTACGFLKSVVGDTLSETSQIIPFRGIFSSLVMAVLLGAVLVH